jgi:hypothetical protein
MATLLPVIPVEPEALHAQKIVDFSDEAELKKHVRSSRWLAIDVGSFKVLVCPCDLFCSACRAPRAGISWHVAW